MMRRFNFLFSDAAAGQGGAAAGGASAGAGAGAGSAAAAGTGGALGAGQGGGQAGEQAYTGPFYADPKFGFDVDTQKFFEGKNYPDIKTALASLPHADKVARDRNVISKPDLAKLNDWSGWSDLGWIDNAEKYAAAVPKPELKEGERLDEASFGVLTKAAHEARMLPSQTAAIAKALHASEMGRINEMRTVGAQANKDLDTSLRGEWGGKYDANVELAKRAFKHFKVDEATGAEMDNVMTSPRMVKLFHAIGAAMGEGNLVDPNGQGDGLNKSDHPRAIEAELNRLEQDPDTLKILNDERDPRYQEVTDRRRDLIKRLDAARKRHGQAA